ncbi:hypothetical protein EV175_005499 [Coemansia sp. RSA 1933]|nr:hypothetical protein EV175_005499 [Coemansia sp. RSA 1933]
MTRTMYHLPEDVRARISWFGLCMGSDTALSTSEYGALSGAFPNALNLSVELGNIVIKEKSIYRALVDPQVPARITTLTIRLSAMTSQSMGFRLVQRTARSLEYLDLGRVCLVAVCMLLWPEKHTQENDHVEHLPVFPNLAHLRFTLVDTVRVDPEWNPRWCEFPRLERMCFSVTSEDSQGIRGMSSPMDPVARQWLAVRLLMYPLPRLKHLELDCVDEAVIFEAHPCLPGLVHLHLIQHTHLAFGPESNATEPSLSRILNSALSIDSLKLASSIHGLRELNIATWSISLCDLQLLLAKLPELEGIHATLTDAHMHPQPESIAYNVTMKRMWLDTAFGDVSKWVRGPVDSLLAFISHMMNLEELLLFTKAFQRLGLAISCKSNEDLIRLARTANIGQCHRDENQIKSQTAGPIR